MKPLALFTRWIPGIVVAGLLAIAAAIPFLGRSQAADGILIHARMAENGGWTPADLQARVGQELHLRLTSDDVTHSFAIGQSEMEPVDVLPGEVSEVTLKFDRPGKYTFYCTRWCGPNHWRMRGVIEVAGEVEPPESPLYVALGLDIDAPHPAEVTPAAPPSQERGESLAALVPDGYTPQSYYRTHSPTETWQALRQEPGLAVLSDQQVWDVVAALIKAQTNPEMLAEGQRLFSQNCAACHGESGEGNGVFASKTQTKPANLADPATILGASPALLQGKIVRGGMGTGMPYWGPVLTEDQTWALVAYIQSLQFERENQP